jgi:hypothetical protein
VPLLQGAPDVKDLQSAMQALVQEHYKARGGSAMEEGCGIHAYV